MKARNGKKRIGKVKGEKRRIDEKKGIDMEINGEINPHLN